MINLKLENEIFNEILKNLTALEEYCNLHNNTEKADKIYKVRQALLVSRSK